MNLISCKLEVFRKGRKGKGEGGMYILRSREAFFRDRRGRLLGFSRELWSGLWRGRRLGRGRFVVLRTSWISCQKEDFALDFDRCGKNRGVEMFLCEIFGLEIY